MSKAIVTGGAGFIGSNLVDRLVTLYNEVVVIDNESSEANEIFYYNEEASYFKYDICDYKNIRPLFTEADCVFHLAAEARIQPTLLNPILAAKSNCVGTCTILQCAKEAKVKRVIYSSTSSAYGLKNKIPLVETMPNDCLNPYSVTKAAGEDLCKMYNNLYGLETVVFRYFNVYGERHPVKGQYAPVIGIFIRQKQAKEKMTIVGDGKQTRDFTHVSDVVEANVLASNILNKKPVGQTINLGSGTNFSVNQIAEIIGGDCTFLPARPGEAKDTLANIQKAKDLLGWKPLIHVQDWIKNNS
tara:strand:+ start:8917 stop:9816 length:900 start_codon:yes stop_codon:yes gene_type:complete